MSSTIELNNGEDTVLVSFDTGADGAFVIFLDTPDLSPDRALRVNVNDSAVYSAHVERGDHDLHYIREYIDEVIARD